MSFVWVQQWFALPLVVQGQMGDLPPDSRSQTMDYAAAGLPQEGQHVQLAPSSPYHAQDNNNDTPFYSQLNSVSQGQHRPDHRSPAQSTAYYAPQHDSTAFKMGAMAGALPDHGSDAQHQSSQSVPRSLSGASTSALVYQLGQSIQMPTHAAHGMPVHPSYGTNYGAGPYQQGYIPHQNTQSGIYPTYNLNQPRAQGVAQMQNPYQPYPQPSPYMYYPAPYGAHGQYQISYPAQGAQAQTAFGRRPSLVTAPLGIPGQNVEAPSHEGSFTGARLTQGDPTAFGVPFYQGPGMYFNSTLPASRLISPGMPRSASVSSIPRGPPRKPKQSGHALWVGNLPPGTTVVALKDHFSREATKDIESLFLISKSNCAFVNYRTEDSCTAAMHRFHDSRFNGVRLVCRLRRSSAPSSGIPTGPSAMAAAQQTSVSPPMSPRQDGEAVDSLPEETTESLGQQTVDEALTTTANKYFIVKSLTLQDLELSIRNGIWATQSHNEDVLNKAYKVRLTLIDGHHRHMANFYCSQRRMST